MQCRLSAQLHVKKSMELNPAPNFPESRFACNGYYLRVTTIVKIKFKISTKM